MTQQLTAADLKGMSPEDIAAAHDQGRLDAYLGRHVVPTEGQLTEDQLALMDPEQIVAAVDAGRLDTLLGREPT